MKHYSVALDERGQPGSLSADLYAAFEFKGAALINQERGVVQLLNCSGGAYAQFAVTKAVATLMQQQAMQD